MPIIQNLQRSLTKILITWEEPKVKNGIINEYEICWKIEGNIPWLFCLKILSGAARNFSIENLNPGITYIVTVNASTLAGFGPEDKIKGETLKSGKFLSLYIYNMSGSVVLDILYKLSARACISNTTHTRML